MESIRAAALPTAFVAAVVALFLQLFPSIGWAAVYWIDVRHWSWTALVAFHVVLLAALVALRVHMSN